MDQPTNNLDQNSEPVLKKNVSLLAIIFLIVLFSAGAFFLGQYLERNKNTSTQATVNPTIIPTTNPTAAPQVDETANWKIYIDLKSGFSIKYPPEVLEIKNNGLEPIQKLSNGGIPYSIYFTEYKNPTNLSLQDLVAKTYNYNDEIKQTIKYSTKTIGSHTVSVTENLLSQDGSKDVFFTKDGQNYISISLTPNDPSYKYTKWQEANTIFDQILSTFKFLL